MLVSKAILFFFWVLKGPRYPKVLHFSRIQVYILDTYFYTSLHIHMYMYESTIVQWKKTDGTD